MKNMLIILISIFTLTLVGQERILVKDSLKGDLDVLYQVLDEVHPGTYRYLNRAELKEEFTAFYENLPKRIPEGKFMSRLAQLVAKVKCGHTYLNPWNMDGNVRNRLFGGKVFLPFGIEVLNGNFYITENVADDPDIKKGAKIISINGIPSEEIYDRLRTIAKTDGNNYSSVDSYLSIDEYGVRDWEAFDIYFSLFFDFENDVIELVYQNYDEQTVKSSKINLYTKEERASKIEEKYGNLSKTFNEWKVSILDEKTALLKIGTFAIWNFQDFNYKKWLKETFQELDELKIEKLILDIRGNGGGDSDAKDDLLTYLIKEKIMRKDDTRSLIRTNKLPTNLIPYSKTYLKSLVEGLPSKQFERFDSEYYLFTKGINKVVLVPKKRAFKGEVYILGNGSNTSATYTMLQLAKTYKFATFVGSESGGNLQGINGSQYIYFYLPYSKMEVDIPLIYSQATSKMEDRGVKPDVAVRQTQESIALSLDPYLRAIL